MENKAKMDKAVLRKLQIEELNILNEVDRVCKKNKIEYFLVGGTLLGAVRNKGFIPWDDLDIAMMRKDYDRFSKIAEEALGKQYVWQTMENDDQYPGPYGKVRKKGTVCLETSAKRIKNNGIYIDVFAFDDGCRTKVGHELVKHTFTHLGRLLLVKSGYKVWKRNTGYNILKKIAYFPYVAAAKFVSHKKIVEIYNTIRKSIKPSDWVYEQGGHNAIHRYKKVWIQPLKKMEFEGRFFPIPNNVHKYLTVAYGNYMALPPKNKRYNRHGFSYLDFGDGVNRA